MMKTQKRVLAMIALIAIASLGQASAVKAATMTDGVTLDTEVQEVIELDCGDANVSLGNLTPGTPVTGSSTCLVDTNANGGFTLSVRRDDATDTTMDKGDEDTVNIADLAAWDPTANTNAGNAAAWVNGLAGTQGLGFTVFASNATKNATWWGAGAGVTDAANLYAGFAPTQTTIMEHITYIGTTASTSVGYKLDVPATQKSGVYTGAITYQATTRP